MRLVTTQPAGALPMPQFLALLGHERATGLLDHARVLNEVLDDGVLWHVNSTDAGGGVAEMLHTLVPMYQRCGVDTRWAVIEGDARFFDITKRLGNLAYGSVAETDRLSADDRRHYLARSQVEAEQLLALVRPGDVVLLHDHQTAGLAHALSGQAAVYWRCHVGVDTPTAGSAAAWAFLTPLLDSVDAVAFSVSRHVPAELGGVRSRVITPVIWPFSPKNRALPDEVVRASLTRCGLADQRDPAAPLVVQVSRWDRLKDMHGVLAAFAEFVPEGHLALVGPDPAGIPDDVDQARWLAACSQARSALPSRLQRRVSLICLPMTDLDHNAILVNSVQRAANVIVQKSLAEGFGLTVTEAMWKRRAVIGSAVGGIAEQITHGHNGFLLPNSDNHAELGDLINRLLRNPTEAAVLGEQAHRDVHWDYLPDSDFAATSALLTKEEGR